MENLNDLYLHSMVHPDVAAAYINGENVPEAILQGEVPDPSVQAHYEPEPGPKPEPTKYTVKVISGGNGTVEVEEVDGIQKGIQKKDTEITVDEGATVKITATPNEGYAFVKWNDGTQDYDTAIVSRIEVNSNLTFTATFEAVTPSKYTVTAVSSDLTMGTVSIPDGTEISGGMSKEVDAGGSVTITATVVAGPYDFDGWTSNDEPIEGDSQIEGESQLVLSDISNDINVVAHFKMGSKKEDLPGTNDDPEGDPEGDPEEK